MATLQGKAVKNTYRQVLQIGANNVGVSGTSQRVQDGAGVNTALSLSTIAATIHGDLTITGDLIITGGGIQIQDLIDDTVASLIQNGTGITWTYNDGARTLTGNFTGTTSVVAEGSNLYYTQGRFDSAFAAKTTTNLTEGTNLYFTTARGDANFATNFATKTTTNLPEGSNLYFTNARARTALSVTGGTGIAYDNATGVFNLAAIPNASLANSSITINGQSVSLGGTVTLTTTNIAEGTNLYWTEARGNANFATNLAASTTTNLAEGTNLYYTQARFDTAFSNKSTTNLAEGTNLYYTQARFNSALAAKTTTDLAEGSNLYYTDTRARLALSSSATGLSYANNSGVFSLTAGYAIPTSVKLGQYDTAYNRSIVSAAVSGTTTKTLSLTQQDANVVSATWTDLGITTINGTTNQIAATTVANTTTLAFTNDVTMPNNLVVSGNLTINGTATYVNTQSISAKDPLFEVANDNNTTDVVDIGYYGRYYDTPQTRVEFTGLFRDASDAGKFKFFTGLVDEPTNVVNTTGVGYTVGTLVANFEGNLVGTANAANALTTARSISATGDAAWTISFNGSADVTAALTLANTGVTATTYGTSTAVPTIAIDSKGRITSASNTNIAFPVTSVNGASGTVVLTTTNIAEGTNQYFTSGRAQSAITISTTGTSGAATYTSGNINVPIYIGGSGSINQLAYFDTTGTISSLTTATYPSLTELSYLKGVTSAIQSQINTKAADNAVVHLAGAETITGAKTFSDTIVATQIKAATSAGLSINANSGTQVADFGAGGGANMTLFGGLSGTSASFSSTATANAFIPSGATIPTNGMYLSAANTLNFATNTTNRLSISSIGAATFSSSVTASNYIANTGSTNTTAYILNRGSSSFDGVLEWQDGGSSRWKVGTFGTGSGDLRFYSAATGGYPLTLNYGSGAATFSSSITASGAKPQLITSGVSAGAGISLNTDLSGANRRNWFIGTEENIDGDFVIKCSTAAGGNALVGNTRISILNSGNVIIGPSSDAGITLVPASGTSKIQTAGNGNSGAIWHASIETAFAAYENAGCSQIAFKTENKGSGTTDVSTIQMVIRPTGDIRMTSLVAAGSRAVLADANGQLSAPVSDESVKENIRPIKYGINEIMQMNPVWFEFIDEYKNYGEGRQNGNIAQEMEAIIPEAVFTTPKTGKMGINYDQLHAVYIKAIQELKAEIEELRAMIAAK